MSRSDSDDDYFLESVPDGISTAVHELFPGHECTNQDSYELLCAVFGDDFGPSDLERAGPAQYLAFAAAMASWFELGIKPTAEQASLILDRALRQWR